MDPVVTDPLPPSSPPPFKWQSLLPVLGLVLILPAIVAGVKIKQLIAPKAASGGTVASVAINPGQIITLPGASPIAMSALAFDTNSQAIDSGLTYTWGMSSTNSIGTIKIDTTNTKLAIFYPDAHNIGQGDIFVQASGSAGSASGSIPVYVGTQPTTPLPTIVPTATPLPTSTPIPSPNPPSPTPVPTPLPSVVPTSSPSATPTPTPTPVSNVAPRFITRSLPSGRFLSRYVTEIVGSDINAQDVLSLSVVKAPLAFTISNCVTTPQLQTFPPSVQIKCAFSGWPYWRGSRDVILNLKDNHSGETRVGYSLTIN